MSPVEYMKWYRSLTAWLEDDSILDVDIAKYLNARFIQQKDAPTPKNDGVKIMTKRATAAWAAKDKLIGELCKEFHCKHTPTQFLVDDFIVPTLHLVHVFTGKGSPSMINTVIWLASRYKHLTATTLQNYADRCLGLDCNGFVNNYFGRAADTDIARYDSHRRKDFQLQPRDVLVFYTPGKTVPKHIAVVDSVLAAADSKGQIQLRVVQSGGPEEGLHDSVATWKLSKMPNGDTAYKASSETIVYFVPPPLSGGPNP